MSKGKQYNMIITQRNNTTTAMGAKENFCAKEGYVCVPEQKISFLNSNKESPQPQLQFNFYRQTDRQADTTLKSLKIEELVS